MNYIFNPSISYLLTFMVAELFPLPSLEYFLQLKKWLQPFQALQCLIVWYQDYQSSIPIWTVISPDFYTQWLIYQNLQFLAMFLTLKQCFYYETVLYQPHHVFLTIFFSRRIHFHIHSHELSFSWRCW